MPNSVLSKWKEYVMSLNVAVVVPCHAHREFLPDALTSIEAQSSPVGAIYPVIDNDWTWEGYAEEALAPYEDTIIECYENYGVSSARNLGIEAALIDGYEWVICLDEDDLMDSRYVYRLLQADEAYPDADIFYPDWSMFGAQIGFVKTDEYNYDELVRRPFIISSAAIRTRTWELVRTANGAGFDEDLHALGLRWEDYLFFLEAGHLGAEMARIGIGGALVKVRRHQDKSSGSDVANATIPQWVDFVTTKFEHLYQTKLVGLATGMLWQK